MVDAVLVRGLTLVGCDDDVAPAVELDEVRGAAAAGLLEEAMMCLCAREHVCSASCVGLPALEWSVRAMEEACKGETGCCSR